MIEHRSCVVVSLCFLLLVDTFPSHKATTMHMHRQAHAQSRAQATLTMPRARREPRRSDVASTNMTRSRAQEKKDIVLHFLVTQAATE
jgi:hypothetical protein